MHIPSRQLALSLMTSNSSLIVGKQSFALFGSSCHSRHGSPTWALRRRPSCLKSWFHWICHWAQADLKIRQVSKYKASECPSWIIVYTEVRSKHKSSENVQITKLPHTNYYYLVNNYQNCLTTWLWYTTTFFSLLNHLFVFCGGLPL